MDTGPGPIVSKSCMISAEADGRLNLESLPLGTAVTAKVVPAPRDASPDAMARRAEIV